MLQTFDLIFYKGTSLAAKVIMEASDSKYSHVALILDTFHTLESNYKTPTSIQHFAYPKGSFDVYELTVALTPSQKEKILDFIRDNINVKYDWKYIISRGLHLLFGTKIRNSKDRYNCDELIVDAFRYAGVNLIDNELLFPESITKSSKLRIKKEY